MMLLTVESIGCHQSGWRGTWYSDMLPSHPVWSSRNCCQLYTVKRSCTHASVRICILGGQVPSPLIIFLIVIYVNSSFKLLLESYYWNSQWKSEGIRHNWWFWERWVPNEYGNYCPNIQWDTHHPWGKNIQSWFIWCFCQFRI